MEDLLREFCSAAAREQLDQLREHPLYPLIIENLATTPGGIYSFDVQRAFENALRENSTKPELKRARIRRSSGR